jgi:hypothetical protein
MAVARVSSSVRYGTHGHGLILSHTDRVGALTVTDREGTGAFLPISVRPKRLVLAAPKAPSAL